MSFMQKNIDKEKNIDNYTTNKNVIKILSGHNREVLTVKKFIHPNYGECFISQSLGDGEIKIWINKE